MNIEPRQVGRLFTIDFFPALRRCVGTCETCGGKQEGKECSFIFIKTAVY